jgi:hypothetical protein
MSMRSVQFSVVAILLSFGAVVFGARPAQAAICCSNAKCQVENPPLMCNWCTPTCSEEEQSPTSGEVVYDEVESICYVTGDGEMSDEDGAGCEASEAM